MAKDTERLRESVSIAQDDVDQQINEAAIQDAARMRESMWNLVEEVFDEEISQRVRDANGTSPAASFRPIDEQEAAYFRSQAGSRGIAEDAGGWSAKDIFDVLIGGCIASHDLEAEVERLRTEHGEVSHQLEEALREAEVLQFAPASDVETKLAKDLKVAQMTIAKRDYRIRYLEQRLGQPQQKRIEELMEEARQLQAHLDSAHVTTQELKVQLVTDQQACEAELENLRRNTGYVSLPALSTLLMHIYPFGRAEVTRVAHEHWRGKLQLRFLARVTSSPCEREELGVRGRTTLTHDHLT